MFEVFSRWRWRGIGQWLGAAIAAAGVAGLRLHADPLPVKVAVVVTFDSKGTPGEFTYWAQREKWERSERVPGVDHPVLVAGDGVIGVVAGTTERGALQLMALVLSGRFDFTRTYWLCNGIAGVDPADASIGSAAWVRCVVDGDIAYEIDSREANPAWPYAIMPIGSKTPDTRPHDEGWEPRSMVFQLNPRLVAWAYALTKHTRIPDTREMAGYRALYTGYPNAMKPPFVLEGDSLGSNRYWHGRVLTRWANDWTRLWTDGRGNFVMTDMEDQGYACALQRLAAMGRVDFRRVLFLRTASNYCMQPPGTDVNQSLHQAYAGGIPALQAAYQVGSKVVHELVAHWGTYRNAIPGS